MEIELRWITPDRTTTESPLLQFRTAAIIPHWGDWETVPLVVVSARAMKSAAFGSSGLRWISTPHGALKEE